MKTQTQPTPLTALQDRLGLRLPTSEEALSVDWGKHNNIQVSIKRDDTMHRIISGNKWRKLQGTLLSAMANHTEHIISFGGGHSNHLHALAYCCNTLNIALTAIVRGNYAQNITATLRDIAHWGANIRYVDKIEYRKRHDEQYLTTLQHTYAKAEPALIVPEGGSNQHALQGVAGLLSELQHHYDYICCPVGSGGTLAGLAYGLADQTQLTPNGNTEFSPISHANHTKLLGIAMLKGKHHLEEMVQTLLPDTIATPEIIPQFHAGGFAKRPPWLVEFCHQFSHQTGVAVEPVYSGKLCYAVKSLIEEGYFPPNSRVLILHTGGLQGAR